MKFAKLVFWIAGTWGVLSLTPLYFLFDLIGHSGPLPHTSTVFLLLRRRDDGMAGRFLRDRPQPCALQVDDDSAVLEKFSYVLTVAVLYSQVRMNLSQSVSAIPDGILSVPFSVAFFKVGLQ